MAKPFQPLITAWAYEQNKKGRLGFGFLLDSYGFFLSISNVAKATAIIMAIPVLMMVNVLSCAACGSGAAGVNGASETPIAVSAYELP